MRDRMTERFVDTVGALVALAPTATNPAGRSAVRARIVGWLGSLGFTVREVGDDPSCRVVVAERPGRGARLALCGHYDVEEPGEGWRTSPFTLTREGDRVFGRGVADNLGPLVSRLLTLDRLSDQTAPLLFVLQGEEETGSPLAHEVFPRLDLPEVGLWVEETGYFEQDGTQRLLARDLDPNGLALASAVEQEAVAAGRDVVRHERCLNKAFGESRCPFLTHLVRGRPYLAVGPNDPASNIHQPMESLSLANLPLAMRQFETLVTRAAEVG